MFDVSGKAFFVALRGAVGRQMGSDTPLHAAVERACESGDAAATHAVQEALAALGPEAVARLMAEAHKALRESPDGILAAWRGPDRRH